MTDDDRRIFIGGLRFATEESALEEYFRQWGPLSEVKIVRYPQPDNRSKGFGFISFESQAARDHCISEGSHTIDGKTIEIRLSDSNQAKKPRVSGFSDPRNGGADDGGADVDMEDVKFRRLFVGNIDHNWTEDVISGYFGNIGTVKECTIKRGAEGKPLGFSFMTFETSKCVDKIQQLRPHTIQGRKVETKRQVAKQYVGTPEAKLEVDRIWIGAPESEKGGKGHIGLGDNHTDEDLEKYFSKFGTVVKVQQLMWEDTAKKRGYGFVVFDDFDAVDKVVLARVHSINGTRIEVKKAVKDKDRLAGGGGRFRDKGRVGGMQGGGAYGTGGNMAPIGGMGGMGGMNDMNMMNNMGMGNMMGGMGGMGMGGYGNDGSKSLGNGRKRGMERDMLPKKKFRMEIRDPESEIMRSIFVGNLNPTSEKADLEEYFAKFGEIVTVDMKKQPNSNRNRGFAFVIFSKSDEVDNVMAAKPHRLGGTNIDCKRKTPKSEGYGMEERVKKIWIGKPDPEYGIKSYGLNEETTDEVLREHFNQYGKVSDIHQFIWKDTNKKRGYGYITFEEEDTVDKVVLLSIHKVEGVTLQCKKAITKEFQEAEERKRMAMQQNSSINMMGTNMTPMNQYGGMGGMGGMGMGGMGMGGGHMGGGPMGGGHMGGGPMGGGPMGGGPMGGGPMSGGPMGGKGNNTGMNNMQNNMQSMINQMQGGNYGGMGNNMQSMMSQMSNTNDNSSAGGVGGNMKEMMTNMNSMMGSMKKDKEKKKGGKVPVVEKEKEDDTQEKMMGMMGNMMSMMNNMAGMLQTTSGKDAAPAPPPPAPTTAGGYGANQTGSGGGYNQTGYNQSYGANQTGYSGSAAGAAPGYDASNYGYGYGNYGSSK